MSVSRVVELEGHIIDSGMMQAAFGIVMDHGGSFDVEEFSIGRRKDEESYARLLVSADTPEDLQQIVHDLHQHGANPADPQDARLEPAPADRVVPHGFYSTTNHPTQIRHEGEWVPVEDIEMDCAVVVEPDAGTAKLSETGTLDIELPKDSSIDGEPTAGSDETATTDSDESATADSDETTKASTDVDSGPEEVTVDD